MHAFVEGEIVPLDQVSIPIWDLGWTQGVGVTESMRTIGGRIWLLESHLARFQNGLRLAQINSPLPLVEIAGALERLRKATLSRLDSGDDVGLSLVATPGSDPRLASAVEARTSGPRIWMHTFPLDHRGNAEKLEAGIRLVSVPTREIPASCLDRGLKSRSRMHYWIAQRQADLIQPGAQAMLRDGSGHVAESPTATLAAVFAEDRQLVVPPAEVILHGVTWQWLADVAAPLWGYRATRRALTDQDLFSANEVLSLSTPYLAARVVALDGRPLPPADDSIRDRAHALVTSLTGCDLQQQACHFSQ